MVMYLSLVTKVNLRCFPRKAPPTVNLMFGKGSMRREKLGRKVERKDTYFDVC